MVVVLCIHRAINQLNKSKQLSIHWKECWYEKMAELRQHHDLFEMEASRVFRAMIWDKPVYQFSMLTKLCIQGRCDHLRRIGMIKLVADLNDYQSIYYSDDEKLCSRRIEKVCKHWNVYKQDGICYQPSYYDVIDPMIANEGMMVVLSILTNRFKEFSNETSKWVHDDAYNLTSLTDATWRMSIKWGRRVQDLDAFKWQPCMQPVKKRFTIMVFNTGG